MSQRKTATGIWSLVVIAAVFTGAGCGSQTETTVDSPLNLVKRGEVDCGAAVKYSFSSDSAESDLDQAIGPRVETYEEVHGKRVRLEGTAEQTFKGGARIIADDFSVKLQDDSQLAFEWPSALRGQRVVVEGCLTRVYFPRELSRPDTSKWTAREKMTKNNVRALPFGFAYFVREFTYKLAADEPAQINEGDQ
jgi:hypothetical protein